MSQPLGLIELGGVCFPPVPLPPGVMPTALTALGAGMMPPQLKDTLGIIFPPSDIRGIIDKTAQFVAKNGPEFEQRVLADKNNGQKFSFLVCGNPYRAYYDAKVMEFRTGETSDATQQQIPQAIVEMKRREAEKKQKKDQLLALTSYATEPHTALISGSEQLVKLPDPSSGQDTMHGMMYDDQPPNPPPEDQFSAVRPFAVPLDIDIIKLTAQYVARNGQKFLVGLGQRERGNPQFSFLRTTHALFAYFTTLVDAYTRCLIPHKSTLAGLKEDIGLAGRFSSSQSQKASDVIRPTDLLSGPRQLSGTQVTAMLGILERVEARHQWEAYDEKQRHEASKREAEERQQMHAMDWHEFTVVEVINFTEEDDLLPLGPPINQDSLTQPPIHPSLVPIESSFTDDIQNAIGIETFTAPPPPAPIPTIPPVVSANGPCFPPIAPPAPPIQPTPPVPVPQQTGFSNGPPEPPAPTVAPIVVVKGYVRQTKKRNRDTAGMQKCPITGQWISADQMSDHLRILLLDPKWKEQKDILLAKAQKESAFAPVTDFEANLANFVVKRPDLFGTVEDECESSYIPSTKRK